MEEGGAKEDGETFDVNTSNVSPRLKRNPLNATPGN